jgi:HEPN domain-containing protein
VPSAPLYRKDFKALADLRAEEARVLLAKGKQQGAYYLAGYAVECALKACIAQKTKRFEFPPKTEYVREIYSHKLNNLLKVADLHEKMSKHMAINAAFETSWNTVKDWTEESRYQTSGLNGKEMYNAVTSQDGVLPWIKLHW